MGRGAGPVALLVAIRRRGDGGTVVVTRSFARFTILQGRFDSGRYGSLLGLGEGRLGSGRRASFLTSMGVVGPYPACAGILPM